MRLFAAPIYRRPTPGTKPCRSNPPSGAVHGGPSAYEGCELRGKLRRRGAHSRGQSAQQRAFHLQSPGPDPPSGYGARRRPSRALRCRPDLVQRDSGLQPEAANPQSDQPGQVGAAAERRAEVARQRERPTAERLPTSELHDVGCAWLPPNRCACGRSWISGSIAAAASPRPNATIARASGRPTSRDIIAFVPEPRRRVEAATTRSAAVSRWRRPAPSPRESR